MASPPTDALLAAVATALARRLAAAGCGPLRIEGTGSGAEAAAAALARAAGEPAAPAGAGGPGKPGRVAGPTGPGAILVLGPGAARGDDLEELAARTGLSVSFAGHATASPGGVPVGEAVPFALLDPFDPATVGPTPDGFDVLAVVTTFNEADLVEGLLDRLVADGMRVHVIDNWSTDGTPELVAARAAANGGRITHERFPSAHPSPYFELETLLRRVEDVAEASGADWVVHHDADEIREAPWPGTGLRDALYALDRWGFTCADHTVANFVATDDTWQAGGDLRGHFTHLALGDAPGHFLQEKAWRRPAATGAGGHVEIASSGGHEARFAGKRVFPYKLLTRHYPIRSQAHGERKILAERRARFSPAERRRGWHTHYDALGDAPRFVHPDTAGLATAGDLDDRLLLQRLTGAGLPGNPFPGEGPAPVDNRPAGPATAPVGAPGATPGGGGPAGDGTRRRLVRVQSVLFDPSPASLERFLRSLAQSIRSLTGARPDLVVDVALGDCSPEPVCDPDGIERARWGFTGSGTRAVHYDHFGANLGHGGAQNRLFAGHEAPDVLVVVNPDTAPAPDLLAVLLGRLGSDPSIGIAEARQLPLEHQKDYDHVTGDTSWASGACAAVDGALFGQLGGYDADTFFLYCDDVDLSWRARLAGRRVVYEPAARVVHDKRLSPGAAETPSDTEIYHSGLASLLLPWKYARPELAEAHVVDFATSPLPVHHAVADAFEERRRTGHLPAPIDLDHRVGDFSTYAYAPLRFDYAR